MNRTALLPVAYLLDQMAGDPEWFPHPVRIAGYAISRGEAAIRRPGQSNAVELLLGTALTATLVSSTYWLTAAILRAAYRHSSSLGSAAELFLGWTCLAARNLEQEATSVTGALESGDLPLARQRVARIVGRDTQNLDVPGVSRAVIETVAESVSDGVIAPLFYMALGGVPLAMAYKVVNTLDSMIGHADTKYLDFGKAAARLDDAANYIPSRISALAIVAASRLAGQSDPLAALQIWRRDSKNHKSPNAGQPESAMAGALHVALGGDNTYDGELIPGQRLGTEFRPPEPRDAVRAIRLASAASLLSLAAGMLLTALLQTRKR